MKRLPSNMNNKFFVLALLMFACIFGVLYIFLRTPETVVPVVIQPTGCTQEAKLCPDGSSVGRTGPNCTFAECPVVPAPQIKEAKTAALNQKILNNGILITPLEVVADSRCPVDVVCVWAGEVSLKVLLEKGTAHTELIIKSRTPAVVFGESKISLTNVIPENNSKKPFNKDEYRFTFSVIPSVAVATGTVSGTVTLSPVCPVERVPQEPQCTPKPYATTINIREEGKQVILKTIQSNNLGIFTTELPVGSYELEALTVNNAVLPRCTKEIVQVTSGGKTVKDISCDTGIR